MPLPVLNLDKTLLGRFSWPAIRMTSVHPPIPGVGLVSLHMRHRRKHSHTRLERSSLEKWCSPFKLKTSLSEAVLQSWLRPTREDETPSRSSATCFPILISAHEIDFKASATKLYRPLSSKPKNASTVSLSRGTESDRKGGLLVEASLHSSNVRGSAYWVPSRRKMRTRSAWQATT